MLALIFISSGLLSQDFIFGNFNQYDLILNILLLIIGALFLTLAIPLTRKISTLKREKTLYK